MAKRRLGKLLLSTAVGSLSFGHVGHQAGPGVPTTVPPGHAFPHDNSHSGGNGNGNSNGRQGGPDDPPEQTPANCDGQYLTYVKGFFTGSGTSNVSGDAISIQASVVGADGVKGSLSAPSLALTGDHFTGSGTANGISLTFTGRIDGYSSDNNFKGARILVLYTDGNGHGGRIAGVIVP